MDKLGERIPGRGARTSKCQEVAEQACFGLKGWRQSSEREGAGKIDRWTCSAVWYIMGLDPRLLFLKS